MNEWTSVKNRLPEKEQWVLVFLSDPNDFQMEIGFLRGFLNEPDNWWFTNDRTFGSEVTHWMPLPEPPKSLS